MYTLVMWMFVSATYVWSVASFVARCDEYSVMHSNTPVGVRIVGMVNCGHNTNSSWFYITLKAIPPGWKPTILPFGWVMSACGLIFKVV